MKPLNQVLKSISIKLDQLLLDPNNPRFSELGETLNAIPEVRFAEDKVQKITFDRMKNSKFDVSELKDTIKTVGFLPMDRIVIRNWKGATANDEAKYVVIEGNRRVTALKWLIELHESGKETLDANQLDNFQALDCLVLPDEYINDSILLILPGLRHVSGIKEWGAYQKAKTVHALRTTGHSPQETGQSLGLSTIAANRAYRCFLALESMKADEEYGEFAIPKMYSYFEEIFKRPELRNWLNWSDEQGVFTEKDHLHKFYGWMVPSQDDDGEEQSPKLPEAKSVRELARFIDNPDSLAIFESSGSLNRALARYEIEHPEDWFPKILSALSAIKSLTPDKLREVTDDELQKLNVLVESIQKAIDDRSKLIA